VPDRYGQPGEITLGFSRLADYEADHPYIGALIGRYGNRIADGRFSLAGVTYQLARNDGANHLHGGRRGFDRGLWRAEPHDAPEPSLTLHYLSPDGEEGYPGQLTVSVRYQLTAAHQLRLDYQATTNRPTIVNLTHHAYFNLAGQGRIDNHLLELLAEYYLPVDATLIPTGQRQAVVGTPFDFRQPTPIGARFGAADEQIARAGGGYDHCYLLPDPTDRPQAPAGRLRLAARLSEPTTGRRLTVLTTQPALQLYTGNMLDGRLRGRDGQPYAKHHGLCLETQHPPDSPNRPDFPTPLLLPGQSYQQTTIFHFDHLPSPAHPG
jgi:aldose 1-epimerase